MRSKVAKRIRDAVIPVRHAADLAADVRRGGGFSGRVSRGRLMRALTVHKLKNVVRSQTSARTPWTVELALGGIVVTHSYQVRGRSKAAIGERAPLLAGPGFSVRVTSVLLALIQVLDPVTPRAVYQKVKRNFNNSAVWHAESGTWLLPSDEQLEQEIARLHAAWCPPHLAEFNAWRRANTVECVYCGGAGVRHPSHKVGCSRCNGVGYVMKGGERVSR